MRASGGATIGRLVELGGVERGRITAALVDDEGWAVLLRVDRPGGTAYLPLPAVELSPTGVLRAAGPHVLLDRAQTRFYEREGLAWLRDDVSTAVARGIVPD